MPRDGKTTYKNEHDARLWEPLWEVAARANISRAAVQKWLGCTPITLSRITNPQTKRMYEGTVLELTKALVRAVQNGSLPFDYERQALDAAFAASANDGTV